MLWYIKPLIFCYLGRAKS